jgi:hypothetical protein
MGCIGGHAKPPDDGRISRWRLKTVLSRNLPLTLETEKPGIERDEDTKNTSICFAHHHGHLVPTPSAKCPKEVALLLGGFEILEDEINNTIQVPGLAIGQDEHGGCGPFC